MLLDEFLDKAPALLQAFAHRYREEARTDPTFYPEREFDDWWREVAAYVEYTDLLDRRTEHTNQKPRHP